MDPYNVGFIIEHTLVASIDELFRCFLLYADNNKDVSRKVYLLNLQLADWWKLFCEETKDDDQKSSVEVIDKDVSVEDSKMKRFMETTEDSKHLYILDHIREVLLDRLTSGFRDSWNFKKLQRG